MKKSIIFILISFMLFNFSVNADNSIQIVGDNNNVIFIDVPDSYWAVNEITYFAARDIVEGSDNGAFLPDDYVTREEFTKMLALTYNAPLDIPFEPTFSDVDEYRWSYPYIEVSKEFLTGYENPFGGKPAFHPAEYATREDIAVAMVRIMGLSEKDAYRYGYASEMFSDALDISPALVSYISIAAERGIISGYPDGTFKPLKSITRAETVVLLNRATKRAFANLNEEIVMDADVISTASEKTASVKIRADAGVSITVDGQSVHMYDSGLDFWGTYKYTFEQEGSKTFEITGKKGAKTRTISVTAKYQVGAPTITINQISDRVTTDRISISGRANDDVDNAVSIYMNDEFIKTISFGIIVSLAPGKNSFTFKAVNNSGKESAPVEKIIYFDPPAPVLTVEELPAAVIDSNQLKIKGKATDINDSEVKIYVTGVDKQTFTKSFNEILFLREGVNTITFKAVNKYGVESETITKTVSYNMSVPILTVDTLPEKTDKESLEIKGSVTDISATRPHYIYMNGELVGNESFSKTLFFKPGVNTYVFKATNNLGVESQPVTRTIVYEAGGPALTFGSFPEASSEKTITISGEITGSSSGSYKIYMDGTQIGTNSFTKTITLNEGSNIFRFRVTDSSGKEILNITKTIMFEDSAPLISLVNFEETTENPTVNIEGIVKGGIDGIKVYINDQQLGNVLKHSDQVTFSKEVTLNPGENMLVIRAVNSSGKSASLLKRVNRLEIKSPELSIDDIPAKSTERTITISGTISDNLDQNVNLWVNDVKVSHSGGKFSSSVTLADGMNNIVISAANKYGKSITIVKNVEFSAEVN